MTCPINNKCSEDNPNIFVCNKCLAKNILTIKKLCKDVIVKKSREVYSDYIFRPYFEIGNINSHLPEYGRCMLDTKSGKLYMGEGSTWTEVYPTVQVELACEGLNPSL